jgi:hypothetical protein
MKKIEAPYLLFALMFGFMALIAPYLMEEHRLTLEGRVAMLLFQAGMVFACSLSTAKHLHDKWVQEDIHERQARLRMPKPQADDDQESADSLAVEGVISEPGEANDSSAATLAVKGMGEPVTTSSAAQDFTSTSAASHEQVVKPPAH